MDLRGPMPTDRMFDSGKPDDMIIVGAGPLAVILYHFGDGRIGLIRRDGECFAVDADRLAAAIGELWAKMAAACCDIEHFREVA